VSANLHLRLLSNEPFTLAEARSYIADVLRTGAMQEDKRFKKRFLEEFWPLAAIAEVAGDERTQIAYQGASGNVDAKLSIGNRPPQAVEFTIAFDGEQEALRDEHLALYGRAPITADIPRPTATKASGKREMAEVEPEARNRNEQRERIFGRLQAALDRKRKLASKRPDYADGWLSIVLDNDWPKHLKPRLYDPLGKRLFERAEAIEPFTRVFLVSTVGDYVFDSATLSSRLLSTPADRM
jgi:hypothetical protein